MKTFLDHYLNEAEGTAECPEYCGDEHLDFLDALRESGVTNMFGAAPYLVDEFPELDIRQARKILMYWMDTFSSRNPR